MAGEQRMVCVTIGVADAVKGKYLSGAVNDAQRLHAWAMALGYEAFLITDEANQVTLMSLRETLETALWPERTDLTGKATTAPMIDRLIVYFAGHGLLRDAEDALWLLSDSQRILKAPSLSALRTALYRYPIKHLAIMSDACLSLPTTIDQAEIRSDPVLEGGPQKRVRPWLDLFVATQDGETTFMVPGKDPPDDRCIFSGVLLEGLWGLNKAAFSKRDRRLVTGNSLSQFVKKEVQRVSAIYSELRDPSVGATFPEGQDIYFKANPKLKPPTFPPWPPAAALMGMGLGRPREEVVVEEHKLITGLTVDDEFIDISDDRLMRFERTTRRPIRIRQVIRRSRAVRKTFPSLLQQFEPPAPEGWPPQFGLAAFGAPVRAIWHDPEVTLERAGPDPWWSAELEFRTNHWGRRPARILVEFADGPVVATVLNYEMVTKIARDAQGASAIIMPEAFGGDTAALAQEAMLAMEKRSLRAEKAGDFIVTLRKLKHADPVLGVVSAYLYDATGDVDSIRRMAYFYASEEEPIPYDIALLGMLHSWREGKELWASVPAVPERAPQSPAEAEHEWTYQKTEEVKGLVAGDWPWMRQGWAFLDDSSEEESTLIVPELMEVMRQLRPGRFTTLTSIGASILAERFGLKRHEQ